MDIKKSFFVITLISLLSLIIFAGCTEPNANFTLTKNQINVPPVNHTPTLTNDRYPVAIPTPNYLPGGSLNGVTIIVDPGHGGKDPGAGLKTLSHVPEKTINMAIAKELEVLLKAKGARVIMSRNSDIFIELDARAELPGRHNADLLVSIHADSHANRYISGATLYLANNCSYKSRKTAQNIYDSFTDANIKCRGIRNKDFRVLAKHSKPAVLVECGYMTNAYEAEMLNSTWYRNKLAKAIANGIANSF